MIVELARRADQSAERHQGSGQGFIHPDQDCAYVQTVSRITLAIVRIESRIAQGDSRLWENFW